MPDEQPSPQVTEQGAAGAPAEDGAAGVSTDTDVEVELEQGVPAVAELDPETRARREAALRHVRKFGDPVLRASAVPVDRFDAALKKEIETMTELMHDALGVGLAATQLGILHRVLVYHAFPDDPAVALVNPVLEWTSEESESAAEGCLSLPGVHVDVERAAGVRVRAQDETGQEREIEAEGLEARVIQHEMDHLDGVLILDRISREARKEAMRAMREAIEGKRSPAADEGGEPADGAQPASDADARESASEAGESDTRAGAAAADADAA